MCGFTESASRAYTSGTRRVVNMCAGTVTCLSGRASMSLWRAVQALLAHPACQTWGGTWQVDCGVFGARAPRRRRGRRGNAGRPQPAAHGAHAARRCRSHRRYRVRDAEGSQTGHQGLLRCVPHVRPSLGLLYANFCKARTISRAFAEGTFVVSNLPAVTSSLLVESVRGHAGASVSRPALAGCCSHAGAIAGMQGM